MEWKNVSAVKLTADYKTLLQDSEGIRFFPSYFIECDDKEIEYSFQTRLRWENRSLIRGKALARSAIAGTPLNESKSGSWPFLDLYLKKGKEDDPVLKIIDQNLYEYKPFLIPGCWKGEYKVNGLNIRPFEIRIWGRDAWQTRTGKEEKGKSGKEDGAYLNAGWIANLINFIQFLIPVSVQKNMPFDISDFLPLSYTFRHKGAFAASIKTDAKPMLKSLKITFAPDADEEARTMAMAHGALLLYFMSLKIKSPELAAAVFTKKLKNSID